MRSGFDHLAGPRAVSRLSLIAMLLAWLWIPSEPAQMAGGAADAPVATPASLTLALAPGERRTTAVQITNPSRQYLAPLVYEAYADPQPARARSAAPLRAALPDQLARVDPQIEAAAQAGDGRADFLVFLADQADLSQALTIQGWAARGEYVYRTLSEHAASTQRVLRADLAARGADYQPLWIVNAILVHGTPAEARALAGRSEVALVRASHTAALPEPLATPAAAAYACSPNDPSAAVCWNIQAVGANRVWDELGVTGAGVTVATLDSGALLSHPALTERYRGFRGPGAADDRYNWYDPQQRQAAPSDPAGHGTHVLGTILGGGSADQPAIGVAPGAQWIAAQGCASSQCSDGDLIAAAQWLLAPTDPDGRNPRPDLRPMVINNSWSGPGGSDWYSGYTAAWRAAGIFPIFAAGNASAYQLAVCGSIGSPGDDPGVVAVGATDGAGRVASFSLRGPARSGAIKPDLVAPGTYQSGQTGIYSSYVGGDGARYQTLQGTSMAAPHVTGAVALLWSANPALIGDYEATYAILTDTARPTLDTSCGEPYGLPNAAYGYGVLDAFAAVARAQVDVPWLDVAPLSDLPPGGSADLALTIAGERLPGPGTYQARVQIYPGDLGQPPTTITLSVTVVDDGTAVPVSGRVTAAEDDSPLMAEVGVAGGPPMTTDAAGRYTLRLKPGSYTLTARAPGYFADTEAVSIGPGGLTLDFRLEPDQPRAEVSIVGAQAAPALEAPAQATLLIGNTGTRTLHHQVFIPDDQFGIWRSGEPGGPAPGMVTLPGASTTLNITTGQYARIALGFEITFFNKVFQDVYVGANGVVSFTPPTSGVGPPDRCRPDTSTYLYAIAPFRAELDLARGGQVRTAALGQDAFVVSYERIPLRDGPPDMTYSFQVELHRDGRLLFRYGELGALPARLSVGVQRLPGDSQTLGCGPETPIAPGLAVELRPQPPANLWVLGSTAGSVAPGAQAQLQLTVHWARPRAWPYRARALILTSDPTRPVIELGIEAAPAVAPYELRFPVIDAP